MSHPGFSEFRIQSALDLGQKKGARSPSHKSWNFCDFASSKHPIQKNKDTCLDAKFNVKYDSVIKMTHFNKKTELWMFKFEALIDQKNSIILT